MAFPVYNTPLPALFFYSCTFVCYKLYSQIDGIDTLEYTGPARHAQCEWWPLFEHIWHSPADGVDSIALSWAAPARADGASPLFQASITIQIMASPSLHIQLSPTLSSLVRAIPLASASVVVIRRTIEEDKADLWSLVVTLIYIGLKNNNTYLTSTFLPDPQQIT